MNYYDEVIWNNIYEQKKDEIQNEVFKILFALNNDGLNGALDKLYTELSKKIYLKHEEIRIIINVMPFIYEGDILTKLESFTNPLEAYQHFASDFVSSEINYTSIDNTFNTTQDPLYFLSKIVGVECKESKFSQMAQKYFEEIDKKMENFIEDEISARIKIKE